MYRMQLEVFPEFTDILEKKHGETKLRSTVGNMALNNILMWN